MTCCSPVSSKPRRSKTSRRSSRSSPTTPTCRSPGWSVPTSVSPTSCPTCSRARASTSLRNAAIRALTPKPVPVVDLFHVNPITTTVADAVAELLDELPRAGTITFRRLTADLADRIEVIIRFLAVLELYKQGAVELDQPERFGDIEVTWSADEHFDTASILIDAYDG